MLLRATVSLRATALLGCLAIAFAGSGPAAAEAPGAGGSGAAVTGAAPAASAPAPAATSGSASVTGATGSAATSAATSAPTTPAGSASATKAAGTPTSQRTPTRDPARSAERPRSTREVSTAAAADAPPPGGYQPLSPARLLDTRSGLGAPKAALAGHATLTLQVAGRGNVPATGVSAVVLNVTVLSPAQNGYLTGYATGAARPGASNLDFHPGSNTANLSMTALGLGGRISYYNGSAGAIQLVVDVAGYYLAGAASTPGAFTALTAQRVLDTRSGLGAAKAAVAGGGTVSLLVAGRGGVPATGVSAVVLNVTAIGPARDGYLTVFSHGGTRPSSSNLDFHAGVSVANLTVTRLGTGGRIDLFNGSAGSVQLVADVAGYYLASSAGTSTSAGAYTPLPSQRLLDTRSGLGAPKAALAGNATLHLQVAGRAGVPAAGVSAVVLNVTALAPAAAGYLTSYPGGAAQPHTSNFDFAAGRSVAMLEVVPLGADGEVWIHNGSAGAVQLVADVSGYFLDGTTSDTTGGITGQVTEAGTGKPLAGVLVSAYLSSQGEVRVLTDPAGRYYLPALTAGDWYVCYQADQPGLPPTTGGGSATGYQQACQSAYIPVTAGQVSTGVDSALAHGGAIAGRVTDAAGHPLAGVVVQSAVGYNSVSDTGVRTAADGSYRLAGLPPADWKICFDAGNRPAPGLLHQCYLNTDASYTAPYSQEGRFVSTTVDHTAAGVDGTLHPGAAVTGRVTDPAGNPVPGIVVHAVPSSAAFAATTTGADGSYLLSALPGGVYAICFYPNMSSDAPAPDRTYNRQCYQQSYPFGSPNLVLSPGHLTSDVDAHLDHGGSLRVTVTDSASHPLGHVTVTVDGTTSGGSNITSDAGVAQIDGVETGRHRICFLADAATGGSAPAGYLNDCYLNQTDPTKATLVSVTAGAVTPIAESLTAAGGIRLTVTDTAGHPLRGIAASYTLAGAPYGTQPAERTDADGHLLLPRLAAGSYQICAFAGGTDGNGTGVSGGDSAGGYRDRCVYLGDDSPATAAVQLGQVTELSMQLNAMGGLGGTVTDQRGHPLSHVAVTVTRTDGFYQPYYLSTGADGSFSLIHLESAPYTVCFDAGQTYPQPVSGGDSDTGYLNECFDDTTQASATQVQVSAGSLSRTDASLADGAAIAGTLTDQAGNPVPNVQVAVSKDGFAVGTSAGYSDAAGHYRVTSLPPGSGYVVCAYPTWQSPSPNGLGYARQCYLNAPDDSTATPVSVTAGQVSTVDLTLAELASLGGTVTDTHGTPVSSEQIAVTGPGGASYWLYTAEDGTWRQDGVPAGSYTVCYQSYYGTGPSPTGYAPGCYDGQPADGTPTPIAVTAGEKHTVNLRLTAPSAIAGHVSDTAGQPVYLPVELMSGGTVLATTYPDPGTGDYRFDGLTAGTYTVFFDGTDWGYQARYYHDVLPGGTPTAVTVPAETTVTGIDQRLPAAA